MMSTLTRLALQKIGGAVGNGTGSATTFFNGLTTNAGGTTEFSGNVVALTQTFNDDIVAQRQHEHERHYHQRWTFSHI